mmetsp:Transcript_30238/g.53166  ORF Transcript_30238/g.53166 Transcript_30238/m.53166 type:complete len:210 (-) Transcript_30238:163-792(-)
MSRLRVLIEFSRGPRFSSTTLLVSSSYCLLSLAMYICLRSRVRDPVASSVSYLLIMSSFSFSSFSYSVSVLNSCLWLALILRKSTRILANSFRLSAISRSFSLILPLRASTNFDVFCLPRLSVSTSLLSSSSIFCSMPCLSRVSFSIFLWIELTWSFSLLESCFSFFSFSSCWSIFLWMNSNFLFMKSISSIVLWLLPSRNFCSVSSLV